MKFVVGENGRNAEKNPPKTPFRPQQNPHGGAETRTRNSDGRSERLTACTAGPSSFKYCSFFVICYNSTVNFITVIPNYISKKIFLINVERHRIYMVYKWSLVIKFGMLE